MKSPRKNRGALGMGAIDDMLPTPDAAPAPAAPARRASKPPRERFPLPPELADRAKNAVVALSGPPLHLNITRLMQMAVESLVAELERKHNRGKPFPPRASEPRPGRPIA